MVSKKDLEKLAVCSELAKGLDPEMCELIYMYNGGRRDPYTDIGQVTFHPNGKSGCILAYDEYIFGIRCDHLMWSEGYFEGLETPGFEVRPGELGYMLYGNHKGSLCIGFLFTRKQSC